MMALTPGKLRRGFLAVWVAWVVGGFSAKAEEPDELARRVIIVANASLPESVKLARHYAKKRAIPEENIIALPMTLAETIDWRTFVDTVYQPLQDELVRRGWIEATASELRDELGRKRYAILGHRISYLVTCRGVPLRVAHNKELYAESKPLTDAAQFRTNQGAVDAELALVVRSGYPINAYVPNPLFRKDEPTVVDLNKLVKVSRLDGPGWDTAMALVDRAIEAERRGLIGRAYVDIGGPHAEGDRWLEDVAEQLRRAEWDLSVDRAKETFSLAARFDAPALYFGWYAGDVNGPFLRPGFRFPPGAVALHIHSFSATTLNATERHWCGPLVARGAAATFGNVYEPYLSFTHQGHLLVRALLRGDTLGDAGFYSLGAVSWQAVMIGDPLYRPFKVRFAEQWAERATLPDALFPYVILREAKRLEESGQPGQAREVIREALAARPGEVLRQELARRSGETLDGAASSAR